MPSVTKDLQKILDWSKACVFDHKEEGCVRKGDKPCPKEKFHVAGTDFVCPVKGCTKKQHHTLAEGHPDIYKRWKKNRFQPWPIKRSM